ncbi:MAG: hypothetical protein M1836_006484 [Candelina mexicana]|nr:MAG: hypothetical protein M1836_006484 [Candelina mexicana]
MNQSPPRTQFHPPPSPSLNPSSQQQPTCPPTTPTISDISVKMYCLNRYSCAHQCANCTTDAYTDHIDLWSQWQDLSRDGAESIEDEEGQRLFERFLCEEGFRVEDVPWASRVAGELRGCLYAQGGYEKRYCYITSVVCQNPIDVDIEHWFVIGPDAEQPFRTANESTVPPTLGMLRSRFYSPVFFALITRANKVVTKYVWQIEGLAEIWDAGASGKFKGPVGSAAHAAGKLWGPGGLYSPGPLPQPLRSTKPRTPTEFNVLSDCQGSQTPTNSQAIAHVDLTNSQQAPGEDAEPAGNPSVAATYNSSTPLNQAARLMSRRVKARQWTYRRPSRRSWGKETNAIELETLNRIWICWVEARSLFEMEFEREYLD